MMRLAGGRIIYPVYSAVSQRCFHSYHTYFFASGHVNYYARYGLYYLRSMQRLHPNVLERFVQGEHVMHHQDGLWNGIWSDLFIETTYMR